jgi:DNA-binding NtrC family response regulator
VLLSTGKATDRSTHLMPYRIVGEIDGTRLELLVPDEALLVGSGAECPLRLDHPTVSRVHAELSARPDGVEVRDLGSKNGTWLRGRRIARGLAGPGDEIRLGRLTLHLEEVDTRDLEVGLSLAEAATPAPVVVGSEVVHTPTAALQPADLFALRSLPTILERLAAGAPPEEIEQRVGAALWQALPLLSLEIRCSAHEAGDDGILYRASREGAGDGCVVVRDAGSVGIEAGFSGRKAAEVFEPLLDVGARLVGLARETRPSRAAESPRAPSGELDFPTPEPRTPALRAIYEQARQMAQTDIGVLIRGESGTGKEVLARYLHRASPRHAGPFVAVNCAALPRDLLESELFGIEKGVATGVDRRAGKFEKADGGTLLLDEIGDMALQTQAMMLRVLQEREVFRIGGTAARPVDVWVVAATNRDVKRLLGEGAFREDLYFRIATWDVELPALRHRPEDLPNLAAYFLGEAARQQNRTVRGISRAALEALAAYSWPGNIRQLRNELFRAAVFVPDGALLDTARLNPEILVGSVDDAAPLSDRLERFEKLEILRGLELTGGDVAAASELLGIPLSSLYRRMSQLGIGANQRKRRGG